MLMRTLTLKDMDSVAAGTGMEHWDNVIPESLRNEIKARAESLKIQGYDRDTAIALISGQYPDVPLSNIIVIVFEVYG